MWLKLLLIYYYSYPLLISAVCGHISDYASTPSNKVEQYCLLAESCIHDTIMICGKNGEEKRTFLDTCDLLEYACDTNQIFQHIEDESGCPVGK